MILRIFCANHTIDEVYNSMFLDIVQHVKDNVEINIRRLTARRADHQDTENGIEILNLVIPKPDIPEDIAQNYKQVKVQWTEQLVAAQQQKTEKIKKETELLKVMMFLITYHIIINSRLLLMRKDKRKFWRLIFNRGLLRRRDRKTCL